MNISKRLWHFNIREVAVRDGVQAGDVTVTHLPGKVNIADYLQKKLEFKQDNPRPLSQSPLRLPHY